MLTSWRKAIFLSLHQYDWGHTHRYIHIYISVPIILLMVSIKKPHRYAFRVTLKWRAMYLHSHKTVGCFLPKWIHVPYKTSIWFDTQLCHVITFSLRNTSGVWPKICINAKLMIKNEVPVCGKSTAISKESVQNVYTIIWLTWEFCVLFIWLSFIVKLFQKPAHMWSIRKFHWGNGGRIAKIETLDQFSHHVRHIAIIFYSISTLCA